MEQEKLASKLISRTEIGKGEPKQESKDGRKALSKKASSPSKKPVSSTASTTSKKVKRKSKKRKKKQHSVQTKPAYTPEYVKRLSRMMAMKSFYIPKPRKRLDENLLEKITLTLGKRQYEIEKDQQMREMIKGFRYSAYKKPEKKIVLKHREYINKLLHRLPIGEDLWSKASSEAEEKDSLDDWMDEWLKGYQFGRSIRREPYERFSFDFKDYDLDFDLDDLKLLKQEGAMRRSRRYVSRKLKKTKSLMQFGDYKKTKISSSFPRSRTAGKKKLNLDEILDKPKSVPESQYMVFLRKKLEQQKQRERQAQKRAKSKISKISESKVEKTIVFDQKEGEPRISEKISVGLRKSKMSKLEISAKQRATLKSIFKLPSKRAMQQKLKEYGVTAKIDWPSPTEFVKQILGLRIKDKLITAIEEETKKDILSERLHGGNPSLMLESIKLNVEQVTRHVFAEYKKQLKVKLKTKGEKEVWKKINAIRTHITNHILNELKEYVDGEGADCTAQQMTNKLESILEDSVTKKVYGADYRVYAEVLDTFVANSKILSGVDKYKTLGEIESFIADILPAGPARITPRKLSLLKDQIYNNLEKAFRDFIIDSRKPEDVQALIDNIMETTLDEFLKEQGKTLGEWEKQQILMKMRSLRSSISKLIEELKQFIESGGANCTTENIQDQIQKILMRLMTELYSEENEYESFIDDLLVEQRKRAKKIKLTEARKKKPKFENIPLVIDLVVKDLLKKRMEKFDVDSGKVFLKQFKLIANQFPVIALKEVNDFIEAKGDDCTMEDVVSKVENWVGKKLDGVFGELHETVHVTDLDEIKEAAKIKISEEIKQKIFKKQKILEETEQIKLKEQQILEEKEQIKLKEQQILEEAEQIKLKKHQILEEAEQIQLKEQKIWGETKQKMTKKTKNEALKDLRFSFKNRVRKNVLKEVREYLRKGKAQAANVKTMVRNIQGMIDRAMNEVLSHYMKDLDVPLVVMGEKLFLNKMDILRGNLTANIMKKVQNYIQERGDFVTAEEIMSKFDNALEEALALVFDDQQEVVFDNLLDKLLYYSKKLRLTEEEKEKILKKEQTKQKLRTALKSRIGKNLKMELKNHVRKSILQVQKAEKVLGNIPCMIDRVMTEGIDTCLTDLDIPASRAGDVHILEKVDATRRNLSNVITRKVKDLIETRTVYDSQEESKNQLESVVDGALSIIFDEGENTDFDKLLDELVLQTTERDISEEKPEKMKAIDMESKVIGDIKDGKPKALLQNPVFLQTLYNKIDGLFEADMLASKEDESKLKAFIEKSIPVKYDDLRKETTMDDILAQRGFHRCVKPVKDVVKQERGAGEGSFIAVRPTRKKITLRKKRQPVEPIIEETVKETVKSFLASLKEQSRGSKKVSVPVVSLEIFSEDKTDQMLPENYIFDSEELRIFMKSLTVGKSYTKAKQNIAEMLSNIVPFPETKLKSVIDGCPRGSSIVKTCYSA